MVFSAEQNYLSNLLIYIYIFIMLIIIIINNAFVCSIFNPVHVIFKYLITTFLINYSINVLIYANYKIHNCIPLYCVSIASLRVS